jgi:hypothetical protein
MEWLLSKLLNSGEKTVQTGGGKRLFILKVGAIPVKGKACGDRVKWEFLAE